MVINETHLDDLTMPYTVAVDLDGTLAQYTHWLGVEHIGEPIQKTVNYLQYLKLKKPDLKVIIHTARIVDPKTRVLRKDAIKYIEEWLLKYNIFYTEIWTDRGKPIANLYIDDLCINVNDLP